MIWRERGREILMGFGFIKPFEGFLFVHLVLLYLQPVSIICKKVHRHTCMYVSVSIYVIRRKGTR